jgi:peptide/nickel transport system substrate-binding protein
MRVDIRSSVIALLTLLAACRGERLPGSPAPTGGTLVVSIPFDASSLFPPLARNTFEKQINDMMFLPLAQIGDSLNTIGDAGFTPRLAERWTWSPDSLSITFRLDARARWHDGRPVRSDDVKLAHSLYVDRAVGSLSASEFVNVDSVSTPDSLTATFWFKRRTPDQFFEVAFNLYPVPSHLATSINRAELRSNPFVRAPVGNGPFRFVRWEANSAIEVVADTMHFRGRPNLDRIIWSVSPDPNTATNRVFAREADLFEAIRGDAVAQALTHPVVRLVGGRSMDFVTVQFNLRDPKAPARPHPIFGDRAVRQALTLAVDRQSLVSNLLDTLGVVSIGPAVRAQQFADSTLEQLPFDLERAKQLLDSAGWRDTNGDTIREKGGRPLEFELTSPTSSVPRVRSGVILQAQLKKVGAKVNLVNPAFPAWVEAVFSTRRFDAAIHAATASPSAGGIRQSWTSGSGAGNPWQYANPAFDAALDAAIMEFDLPTRRQKFNRAFDILLADAPAIWLYEFERTMGLHRRVRPSGVRADYWWAHLEEWYIPPGERIDRDRIGLR